MLYDSETIDDYIQEIIRVREINGDSKLRKFVFPKINFVSDTYYTIIYSSDIHEPSFTIDKDNSYLYNIDLNRFLRMILSIV